MDTRGVYRKFDVKRVDGTDGPGGKHAGCEYFVLDLTHDPHAEPALLAYALSCSETRPELSRQLRTWSLMMVLKRAYDLLEGDRPEIELEMLEVTARLEEHPGWWSGLPCHCKTCRSYGEPDQETP